MVRQAHHKHLSAGDFNESFNVKRALPKGEFRGHSIFFSLPCSWEYSTAGVSYPNDGG